MKTHSDFEVTVWLTTSEMKVSHAIEGLHKLFKNHEIIPDVKTHVNERIIVTLRVKVTRAQPTATTLWSNKYGPADKHNSDYHTTQVVLMQTQVLS